MMTLQFMMLFDVNDAKRVLTSIKDNKIRSFPFLLLHDEALLYPRVQPKKKMTSLVYIVFPEKMKEENENGCWKPFQYHCENWR